MLTFAARLGRRRPPASAPLEGRAGERKRKKVFLVFRKFPLTFAAASNASRATEAGKIKFKKSFAVRNKAATFAPRHGANGSEGERGKKGR
ncbi:hypothetical protein CA264_14670 [Pontibacter actiniarum]|uniref:Uncharacterized protein n=1 Tax=Pontibacter actiniarum TaxID=323450 RepID=A0A1X9YUV3_9BACT|nr:hypothetical protein CA264_14670 [Pontibacter actiniarum]